MSSNYHCDGGLVIIAESLEHARKLVADDKYVQIDKDPDVVYDLAGSPEPRYFVFPDAGCC